MSWRVLLKPPWRTILLAFLIIVGGLGGYSLWNPGTDLRDGRHDLGKNGIWMQHGWLGADEWFEENGRDPANFRSESAIQETAALLRANGIRYAFPHLCPCDPRGSIAPSDPQQVERFLAGMEEIEVLPWVGGVLGTHCWPELETWRAQFVASVVDLLEGHPGLAGIHVNIEPMPTGNPDFLLLFQELKAAMPQGKILSVAAYPPPTIWHRFPEVHWEESYYQKLSSQADQLAVMMYDTALQKEKFYCELMADWTENVLTWAGDSEVLLGIPAYADEDVSYHDPKVENVENALLGIHAGLQRFEALPTHYSGVAIYSEWEMGPEEWQIFKDRFLSQGKVP